MSILDGVVALVDDDASVLRALKRVLIAYEYRVKIFSSAEQYLAETVAGEISCAIIDIHLGNGMSGLELGKRIAAGARETPILFMTGSDDPLLYERAREIGCADFLKKPFLASRLMAALMKLEGRDSGTRARASQ